MKVTNGLQRRREDQLHKFAQATVAITLMLVIAHLL